MPNAGEIVDAADSIVGKFIRKQATESVTSSTTMQDDDDLLAELPVGIWRVQIWLTATGATGGDIKTTWTNTGTMSIIGRSCLGPNVSTTSNLDGGILLGGFAFTSTVNYGLSAANHAIYEDLLIEVSVAGEIQLQWAQVASSGTSTTLSTSSRMYITQVEEY
jgi:hypothetical protein